MIAGQKSQGWLLDLIQSEIKDASTSYADHQGSKRRKNHDYYCREPLGNEVKNQSTVVSSDVSDTIDWMMPYLMSIFTGRGVVSMLGRSPEDVPLAETATRYADFVWNSDNPGFMIKHDWMKSALLYGPSHLKIFYSEAHGHTVIRPCPPEEFLIDQRALDIQGARFVGHRTRRTKSDLIAEGYDPGLVEDLAPAGEGDDEPEYQNRRPDYAGTSQVASDENWAAQEVWTTECYVRVDLDGDGIAEMVKVLVAEKGAVMLGRPERWVNPKTGKDLRRPFAGLCAIPMPYVYEGLSIAELITDLQKIKSIIMRKYLDGLYLTLEPRQEVVFRDLIDPSELTQRGPGVHVRVKRSGTIRPLNDPIDGQAALSGLNYFDQLRENRTGVSPRTQGLGANSLHDTATGEEMLLSQAQSKLHLVAQIFAHTGFKEANEILLEQEMAFQDEPRDVRLTNREFLRIAPGDFNEFDVQVSVGMGAGDPTVKQKAGLLIASLQQQAAPFNLVKEQHAYNTAKLILEALEIYDVERYFTLPDTEAAENQQAPDPAQMAMAEAQKEANLVAQQALAWEKEKFAAEMAFKREQAQLDNAVNLEKAQVDAEAKLEISRIKREGDLEEKAADVEVKKYQIQEEIAAKKEAGGSINIGGDPG